MILHSRIEVQDGGKHIRRVGQRVDDCQTALLAAGRILQFNDEEGIVRYIALPENLHPPQEGDILRIDLSAGTIGFLYRKASPHNALFITERCNSRCIMCSQPPRSIDDDYLIEEILEMLPLVSAETVEMGITGGEPTLLGEKLIQVIQSLKNNLPQTAVHMLTNGRAFKSQQWAKRIGDIQHQDLMLGIPVYSDIARLHDFIVQSQGAFDETIRGILNLASHDVPIEIRVVTHKQSLPRLRETALYIARNFPFVRQVALMGLELVGFARSNIDALWEEPCEYGDTLIEAVSELSCRGVKVLIFNHPLCVLPQKLWPYAVKSISDWKNVYIKECELCAVRERCGGLFASSEVRRPKGIKPFSEAPASPPQCPAFVTASL